jgi:hypothetical protein
MRGKMERGGYGVVMMDVDKGMKLFSHVRERLEEEGPGGLERRWVYK